jgi:putative peptide zinc metalloprotease protein
LIQGGILNTILFIANLLPIAETDGHYIIQDYLEMPRLRPQSLSFIGRGVWRKLARHEHWVKDDFIHLVYGLAAVAGAGLLLYIGVHLWFTMGARLVGTLLSRPLLLAEILAVLMAIAATVAVLRGGLHWLRPGVSVERVLENHIQRR